MSRSFSLSLLCSTALFLTACGGSSSSGSAASDQEVAALRQDLAAAGIQPLPEPPPVSDELVALGQALFFDKILSGNEDVSCATCHLPQFFTGDGRTLSNGVRGIGLGPHRGGGAIVPRNSPPLFALHAKQALLWDGRVEKLNGIVITPRDVLVTEEMRRVFAPELEIVGTQALLPPFAREEMRGLPGENPLGDLGEAYDSVWEALNEKLLDLPGYLALLGAAYPLVPVQDFNFAHAANAIAAFEVRAFARQDSPFERFVRGDDRALSADQVRGAREFFGAAGCVRCHSGPLLTDQQFHNIGLPQFGPGVPGFAVGWIPGADIGRENATGFFGDRYFFRTPSLLNVALTAPYGHGGQFAELRDFVAHYRDAVQSHFLYDIQANVADPELVNTLTPNTAEVLATLDESLTTPIDFDVDAVVDFLHALTASDADRLADFVPGSVPSGLPVF